jgi:hypothetical protein
VGFCSPPSPDKFRDYGVRLIPSGFSALHHRSGTLPFDGIYSRYRSVYIQGVPAGDINIREVVVSTILSKKCICTCVLFRTVSEIEPFNCTVHCTPYRRAPRRALTRAANCNDVDGGSQWPRGQRYELSSLAGIVGSNVTQGMDVCIVCVCSMFVLPRV